MRQNTRGPARFALLTALVSVAAFAAACHGGRCCDPCARSTGPAGVPWSAPPPPVPTPGPGVVVGSGNVSSQIARGRQVFSESCARCHGPAGLGTMKAPQLVGAGALPREPRGGYRIRTHEFVTAANVVGFAMAKMPPTSEVKPPPEDYYAIVAWILSQNGVALAEPLSPQNAESIALGR